MARLTVALRGSARSYPLAVWRRLWFTPTWLFIPVVFVLASLRCLGSSILAKLLTATHINKSLRLDEYKCANIHLKTMRG